MSIELGVNRVPTHGFLDDIKVIRNDEFRYRVLEMVVPVMPTQKKIPVSSVSYKYAENYLRHDFLKSRTQRRFMGEKRTCQYILQRLKLIPLENFSFLRRIRKGAYAYQIVPQTFQLLKMR